MKMYDDWYQIVFVQTIDGQLCPGLCNCVGRESFDEYMIRVANYENSIILWGGKVEEQIYPVVSDKTPETFPA